MDYQNTLQENIKCLKKKFKHLSDDEIKIKARKMADNYILQNIEKIEKEEAKNKKCLMNLSLESLYILIFSEIIK